MANIKIVSKDIKLKNPILIEGFQGTGLVGTLAAQYIAKELKMKQIGRIESEDLPPIALMSEGEIRFPIRIFASAKHNLIMFESELPVVPKLTFKIASAIADWAKEQKVKRVVCLEGIAGKGESGKLFGIGTVKGLDDELMKDGMEILKNGVILGVSAALLLECKSEGIPAVCLMAQSHASFPDGKASAKLVDYLSKKYNLNINSKPLWKEADKFESQIKGIIEKAKNAQMPVDKPLKTMYG
jgi:uncharacterized protein